jgi:prepilin-type N-terminal cleavage/methylation domain-containing protein
MRFFFPHSRHNAFTLVEVLVVIAIIAVLAALAIPSLNSAQLSASRAKSAGNLKNFGAAMLWSAMARISEIAAGARSRWNGRISKAMRERGSSAAVAGDGNSPPRTRKVRRERINNGPCVKPCSAHLPEPRQGFRSCDQTFPGEPATLRSGARGGVLLPAVCCTGLGCLTTGAKNFPRGGGGQFPENGGW